MSARSTEPELADEAPSAGDGSAPGGIASDRSRGLLAGMRVRKKLIFLHTIFSLSLAVVLVIGLRSTVREIVLRAELDIAHQALAGTGTSDQPAAVLSLTSPETRVEQGDAQTLGLTAAELQRVYANAPEDTLLAHNNEGTVVAVSRDGILYQATVRSPEARQAVGRLFAVLVIALLAVYALVALSLEVLVLPRHVYAPIRRILRADRAVQDGNGRDELIPESAIPADELGEIMRSRNTTIGKLRRHEQELAQTLERLEFVAADLARKNQLIERARENLQDADRLRSLAIMSAGLAHEMNTPLTVLKGLAERLAEAPSEGLPADQAALLRRVVLRLEGLSEGLLDFARVRPPSTESASILELVQEAITLVRLDRDARNIRIAQEVPAELTLECDADRMVQVLVNLVRNAVDAIAGQDEPDKAGDILITAQEQVREDETWVSVSISDNGPGIDPEVLPTLFDPFVSTRLESHGTGLGLAVAEGIIREHGGVLLARNHPDGVGAIFEVRMPRIAQPIGLSDSNSPPATASTPSKEPRL